MKKTVSLSFCSILFAFNIHAADKGWTGIPSSQFTLNPPPSAGSKEDKDDLAQVLVYQQTDRREACELGASQEHPSFSTFYGKSDLLTQQEKKTKGPIVEKVMKLAVRVASYHKGKFMRPRPYQRDRRIHPCIEAPTGQRSYPSSHAAAASASACVLSLALPKKADELLNYGGYLGELRVIIGVHHPTDVKAGADLGWAVCEELQQRPDFMAELRAH
ncbi:MAG: phosphatase PAP2 family protein [Bdellovibrionales bacterium]